MSGRTVLLVAVLPLSLVLGPWLARTAVRLIGADRERASLPRVALTTVLLAGLLAGAVLLTGLRPATVALAWAAGAAIVLGAVDLAVHRLPDRVTFPAYAVCSVALAADAVVLGSWHALLRSLAAAAVGFALAALAAAVHPRGLGFGDVKLLALLGLVLGWVGWEVVLAGVFLGLVIGAVVSLALVATRRAGWRTAVPLGPPLLVGAVLALAVAGLG
ncbi:MAG: peptidase prepilin type [Blastococcus sp.]|jgi:leader peptidase (prepilin peptidase)/N-methyltransferase|nr:peptidase prepilin type [Blastococcus sp.]